jgi:hypothetical protein
MRLSNTEILKELGKNIFITRAAGDHSPVPTAPALEDFDATNVNLHLGAPLLLWPDDVEYVVDHRLEHIAEAWKRHGIKFDLSGGKSVTLEKNVKCLAFTQEHISLPVGNGNILSRAASSIVGPIKGTRSYLGHLSNRSWAGRSFLRSAVDAFELKPGTNNHITLEMISDFDIELYEGMPFIQVGFERVFGKIFETHGWVHGQTTPCGGQTPRHAEFGGDIIALHHASQARFHAA